MGMGSCWMFGGLGRDPCLIHRRGRRTRAGCIQRSIVAAGVKRYQAGMGQGGDVSSASVVVVYD